MASVINTNMASLYAQKNLSGAQTALSTSVERLSSGLRINRAKDDAAGLGISEKLKAQIGGINQGIRNANDAVSMMQTAEGSMSEVSDILQRMKELSVQGRNESLDSVQRSFIAAELKQLKDEINAIAERTTFNGMSLLKNALRTQISQASTAGMLSEGATVLDGVSTRNVRSTNATVGNYSITWRSETSADLSASRVNTAVSVQEYNGEQTARTVTINAGDVYEGAQISIAIEGTEGTRVYSVVVGQGDKVSDVTANLISKITQQFSAPGVITAGQSGLDDINGDAIDDQIVFSEAAQLGVSKITVSSNRLAATAEVAQMSSTVDSVYASDDVDRRIVIDSADVIEGRKFTVQVGNANAVSSFSIFVGAGEDATDVAEHLNSLISTQFDDTSTEPAATTADIVFAADGNYGQSKIRLIIEETVAQSTGLTLSSVSDEYGVSETPAGEDANRTVTVNSADLAAGNVISVKINGKEYAYKVTGDDATSVLTDPSQTSASVAAKIRNLLAPDYASEAGVVATDALEVVNNVGAAGAATTSEVTFTDLYADDAVSIGGLTFTASGFVSAADVALKFSEKESGYAGNVDDTDGTFSGKLVGWFSGEATGADVTFTANTNGARNLDTDLDVASPTMVTDGDTLAVTQSGLSGSATAVNFNIGRQENQVFFQNITDAQNGDSFSIAGLTFTHLGADDDDYTGVDMKTALNAVLGLPASAGEFVDGQSGNWQISGTLTDWNITSGVATNEVWFKYASSGLLDGEELNLNTTADDAGSDYVTITTSGSGFTPGEGYSVQSIDLSGYRMAAGDSIIIDGTTFTAVADLDSDDIRDGLQAYMDDLATLANYFTVADDDGGGGNLNGDFRMVDITGNSVTFIKQTADDVNDVVSDIEVEFASKTVGPLGVNETEGDYDNHSATVTFDTVDEEDIVMHAGDSVTIGGLRFTATSHVNGLQLAQAFENLSDGATYGVGTFYGYYEGQLRGWSSGALDGADLGFVQTAATDVANDVLTVSTDQKELGVKIDEDQDNRIVLTHDGAKLGRADIQYTVYNVSNAGQVTVTADAATTGFANKSQTIAVNTVAAGGFQRMNFDQLGISFDLVNDRASAINADSFATYKAAVSAVSVQADGKSEALFQTGANIRDTLVIDGFKDIRVFAGNTNSGDENLVFKELAESMANLDSDVSQSSFAAVQTDVEAMIERISQYRSYFGAQQNRVDYAIANLQSQSENITEANSRIRDTDYAAETANLTKTQIMQQAATAMLAQANQMPNVILALLK